jgi:uncharacterized protein
MKNSSGVASDDQRQRRAMRQVLLFLLIAFGWTWGLGIIALLLGLTFSSPAGVALYVLAIFGPLIAVLILVGRGQSRESMSAFLLRIVDVRRIPPIWIIGMVAAAVIPQGLAKLLGGNVSDVGLPAGGTAMAVFSVGVVAGLAEEPGWRGYMLDRLQLRWNALIASLILGFVWAIWHLPSFFIEDTYHHGLGLLGLDFWMFFFDVIVYSVVLTWLYNNTNRSIAAIVIVHALTNATAETVDLQGTESILGSAILLLFVIVILVIWGPRSLSGKNRSDLPIGV